jgi:hypothetical protein
LNTLPSEYSRRHLTSNWSPRRGDRTVATGASPWEMGGHGISRPEEAEENITMTQLQSARKGIITPEMVRVAKQITEDRSRL